MSHLSRNVPLSPNNIVNILQKILNVVEFTLAEHTSYFELMQDIPYLTLMGKLWSAYWREFWEN